MKRFFILLLLVLGASLSFAANPGDEVVVVYNARVPGSKNIAAHYASFRPVPPNQIFGFNLSTGIEMSRLEFSERLQKPLAKILESSNLWHIASNMVQPTNGQRPHLEWVVKNSRIR